MVHFATFFKHLLGVENGSGIARCKAHAVVVEFHIVNAHALCASGADAADNGHDVFEHVLAEFFHFFAVIANSAHAVVAKLDKVFVSHLFCHAVTHFYKSVKRAVKDIAVFLKHFAERVIGFFSRVAVRIFHISAKYGQRHFLSAEIDGEFAHKLRIFVDDRALFLQIGHNALVKCFERNFIVFVHSDGQSFFDFRAEGR